MSRRIALTFLAASCLVAPAAFAGGFTQTAPADTFVLDENVSFSVLTNRYDDDGNSATLIDPVERYEPGGGLQGVLTPNAEVNILVLITQLQYGILENLTVGVGIPVVLYSDIKVDLEWESGDYMTQLGRSYSEDDFWEWAASMGQPKPESQRTNQGVLSDIVLGLRYRFSDDLDFFKDTGFSAAVSVMGALPTGAPPDPEEIVSMGTDMWSLHSQGELCFHLSFDWNLPGALRDRLGIGLDFFYEFLFEHEYTTPEGNIHPLLLNYADYVGDTYTIDPGDFKGVAIQLHAVPWKGPALATWIVDHDAARAEELPPMFSLALRYTFTHLSQSDWTSDSAIWDWDREKMWLPGYKNTLWGKFTVSLLRVGVPLQLYFAYRNQTWLSGKNSRAADVYSAGITIPARFW